MSSTPVSADIRQLAEVRGAPHDARRGRATRQSWIAAIATMCCASTSSGLRGTRSDSIAPFAHAPRDDRRFEQVAAMLREDAADATSRRRRGPRGRRAAARDATEPGDSTSITRSTAPMSMPSSSELVATMPRSVPRLQPFLDLLALLVRERAVMRAHQLLARLLVQPLREPLAQAAAVDEHDRRAVRADQLEDARIDRRPDAELPRRLLLVGEHERARWRLIVGRAPRSRRPRSRRPGASCPRPARRPADRSRAARARPRSLTGRSPPRKRATSSAGRAVADRPMRCGSLSASARQPLERQREVRAALGRGHRVDLVHDHPLDRAQRLARLRAENQEERLGRGHQDLAGIARKPAPRSCGRVARAHVHARQRTAARSSAAAARADAGERRRAGCARCRRRAPSAGRRRRRARPAGSSRFSFLDSDDWSSAPSLAFRESRIEDRESPSQTGDRARTGTPRASSRSRSARSAACGRRTRSAPTRAAGPRWVPRRRCRTSGELRGGSSP